MKKTTLLIVLSLLAATTHHSLADEAHNPNKSGNIEERSELPQLDSRSFEAWILAEGRKIRTTSARILQGENELKRRVKNGQTVTDTTILALVRLWENYESPYLGSAGIKDKNGQLFPDTRRLCAEFLPLFHDRPFLVSSLHEIQGDTFLLENDQANASKAYQESVAVISPEILKASVDKARRSLKSANALRALGKTKEAEPFYIRALGVPFYLIDDPEQKENARQVYDSAISGLISVRRNDLKGLKEIKARYFALEDTKDDLDRAIEQAQKDSK